MSRELFDVNVPKPLARLLIRHDVELAEQRGWRDLTNGALLAAAETAGFEVLLTADRRLRYQQNLIGRRIGIVVMSTNAWPVIRDNIAPVIEAVDAAAPSSYREIALPRPALNRRPPPDR